jgi:NitT/TauT family transport system substrate-binding protein
MVRLGWVGLAWTIAAAVAVGCAGEAAPSTDPAVMHLGYFPNITHAAAIAGVENGYFADALAGAANLETLTFNAGPDAVTAILAGSLDASFVGPNPAINAFVKSHGEAIRIVSGATSGGAFFVVRDGINSPQDLVGRKIATPQLGNTQDVALRSWLSANGLTADTQGGGDVSILPQSNSQTLQTFQAGEIDGAWVPEPWATRMITEGGAHVLVDERDLWPNGQYVTTLLMVRTDYLTQHRDVVKHLIEGLLKATDYVNDQPADAQATVGTQLTQLTGTTLPAGVLGTAWGNLTFTMDPIAGSLQTSADDARALGFLDTSDLTGIFDLSVLNGVLSEAGQPTVAQP